MSPPSDLDTEPGSEPLEDGLTSAPSLLSAARSVCASYRVIAQWIGVDGMNMAACPAALPRAVLSQEPDLVHPCAPA